MKRLLLIAVGFFCLSSQADIRGSEERVVLRTDFGDLVLVLFPQVAPKTVKHFLNLVRAGVYDTTHFFRVHPGFVAQVSDAAGRRNTMTAEQLKAITKVPAEFSQTLKHGFGTLSMARYDNDNNSGEMSFSILLGPAPHLDGKYTIFGQMESGTEIMEMIQKLPRNEYAPLERINIRQALVAENRAALERILMEKPVVPLRQFASISSQDNQLLLLGALCLIAFICAVVSLGGKYLGLRGTQGLHFVNLLVAMFALLVVLGPQTSQSTWLGGAVVLSLLGMFRLFSRFESA